MKTLAPMLLALSLAACGWQQAPLASAANAGDLDAVRALVARGVALDQRSGMNGWTALMHAVHRRQHEAVRALLEAGADPNLVAGDRTALLMAAGHGDSTMVAALLDGGADPMFATADGFNALAAALLGSLEPDGASACRTDAVRVLRARAPDLRLPVAFEGRFPHAVAQAAGCPEAIELARSGG